MWCKENEYILLKQTSECYGTLSLLSVVHGEAERGEQMLPAIRVRCLSSVCLWCTLHTVTLFPNTFFTLFQLRFLSLPPWPACTSWGQGLHLVHPPRVPRGLDKPERGPQEARGRKESPGGMPDFSSRRQSGLGSVRLLALEEGHGSLPGREGQFVLVGFGAIPANSSYVGTCVSTRLASGPGLNLF